MSPACLSHSGMRTMFFRIINHFNMLGLKCPLKKLFQFILHDLKLPVHSDGRTGNADKHCRSSFRALNERAE